MARRHALSALITVTCATLLMIGCSDDDAPPPDTSSVLDTGSVPDAGTFSCPTEKLLNGASCADVPKDAQCQWVHQTCNSGGSYVVNWVCTCDGATWSCAPDCLDCCRPLADQGVPPADLGDDAGASSCTSGADCAGDEYCLIECLCCGAMLPDASTAQPSSRSECRKIPTGCDASAICGCDGISGSGVCNATTRTVDLPCA